MKCAKYRQDTVAARVEYEQQTNIKFTFNSTYVCCCWSMLQHYGTYILYYLYTFVLTRFAHNVKFYINKVSKVKLFPVHSLSMFYCKIFSILITWFLCFLFIMLCCCVVHCFAFRLCNIINIENPIKPTYFCILVV